MAKILHILSVIFFIGILVVIFQVWFIPHGVVSGGDWWPNYFDSRGSTWYPIVWSAKGMGQLLTPYLTGQLFASLITILFGILFHLPPELAQRVGFLYPVLILGAICPYVLYNKVFPEGKYALLASILFFCNTYTLLLIGGGQIFITLALTISYLAISCFITLVKLCFESSFSGKKLLRQSVQMGLLLGIEGLLDFHILYITVIALAFYYLYQVCFSIQTIKKFSRQQLFLSHIYIVLPFILCGLLHSFWLLPAILVKHLPTPESHAIYTSLNAVSFFSFAKFENTLGLLHPNWPENIFGKVSFMKPEFLLLPFFAFGSLLFPGKKIQEKSLLLFFSLLALVGIFLGKGTQLPFGQIYSFAFSHIPGFVMFRDPTKWYTVILLSYTILIPYTVEKIVGSLRILPLRIGFIGLFIFYLLFLIRPALTHSLTGTVVYHQFPHEYQEYNNFIDTQSSFFRTLWIPHSQRFAFATNQHPIVTSEVFFPDKTPKQYLSFLKTQKGLELVQESGIKYVVIPSDSEKEIFINDRKYSLAERNSIISAVKAIPWIGSEKKIGDILLFTVPQVKNHFWIADEHTNVSSQQQSPASYLVHVTDAKKGERLVFSEGYDSYWQTKVADKTMFSEKYHTDLNSFILPKNGDYSFTVYYQPQIWTLIGYGITIFTFGGILFLLCLHKFRI